jgi:beta-exotoxin I transport system permease protein
MTSAAVALVVHSLRRIGAMLIGLAALLGAFEFLLTQVATYLLRHSYFSQLSMLMPEFVRTMIGPSSLAFMSFTGIVAFGYFHPMVIAATVALTVAIATEPAGEVETRFVDLTLARELTRLDVIMRTLIVFVVATAFVLGLMMLGTWTGLSCCTPADAPHVSGRLIASLAFSMGTIMACWCGIGLAVAVSVRRRAVASGIVGVAALAAFLLDYLGRAWEPAREISKVSPFHYFDPTSLIIGQPLSTWNSGVLIGIGVLGSTIGYFVFSRRDI